MIKKQLFLAFVLAGTVAYGQKLKKEDRQLMENLRRHVEFLSDDRLEGRRTGTPGEKLAAEYISREFGNAGLQPKGTEAFFQPFPINEGKQINPSTHLFIDGHSLVLEKEFFPLVYSSNTALEALPSPALHEPGMPWFYNIQELREANASNPHFDIRAAVYEKAREVEKKGGTALFLYSTEAQDEMLKFEGRDGTGVLSIPVVYISANAAKRYLGDASAALDIKLKTDIGERKRTGTNVLGYIDNGAANTVVLGAHFDHLGMGEDGNSRELERRTQVHNGADDNASGTAALIELGRMIKASSLKNNNYLFIAFSGEELGLYGSKYFTENPSVNLGSINYMINMDMVGRLNDSSNVLTIGGYGTSPSWGQFYNLKGKNKLHSGNMVFRYDSSGTGPSDHMSFYVKNIPVLFFFTGLHSDYHKPTDDHQKINYLGQLNIVKHIFSLLQASDKQKEKLAFLKTREAQTTTSARFSVSLGIMPDYTFSGAGVRVDGVSENKPAQKAGLRAGDVITALGDYKITSLETYMQALGKYKKGDQATVGYTRGENQFSTTVEF